MPRRHAMQTETPTPSRDDAPPSVPEAPVDRDASPRRVFWGLRARIMFWSVVGLAVAVLAGVLVVRQALLVQLDNRIDDALVQEADELRSLSRGRDPLTGERSATTSGASSRSSSIGTCRRATRPTSRSSTDG